MAKKVTPKFKVGDSVKFSRSDLYNLTYGKISEVQKLYWEIDPRTDKFKTGGLAIMENTIPCTAIPYTFKNDVLRITFPENTIKTTTTTIIEHERTTEYRLHSYVYTVKNDKMSTVYSAKQLTRI